MQHAVRDAADAPTAEAARYVLTRAIRALEGLGGPAHGPTAHPSGPLAVLGDVIRLLALGARPRAQDPHPVTTEPDPGDSPARAGDVLCLLRLSSAVGRVQAAAGMSDLKARATAIVRSGDRVVVVDDVHLLVVMERVPVPVAWRRMAGLVGKRPGTGADPVRLVHGSVARVGSAGPGAALQSAKAELGRLGGGTGAAAGWIALAEDVPAEPGGLACRGS